MMKYFLLILSASLFWLNSIVGLETNGVDVLAVLKKDVPDCKLREFVQTDDHLSKLEEDLKTFCSNEQTSKTARYLCRMLIYEITIACKISKDNRPSSAKYADVASVDDVCGRKNIRLTNQWILSKVSDQDNSIGANDENLCQKIVEDKNILRLARFFYKISPNVRKYDTAQNNKVDASTKLTNVETTKDTKGAVETVVEKGKAVVGSVVNTSSDVAGAIKDKVNSAIDTAKSALNDTAQAIQQKGNQIADTVKQGVDAVKDKAGQAVDAVKQGAEGAQKKTSETVDAAKDKAGQVVDAAKEKTGQAVDAVKQGAEGAQQKASETVDAAKDKAGQAVSAGKQVAEEAQQKVTEIIDIAKNKTGQVVEEVKDKVSTSQSVLAIGTTKTAESSVDKAKQAVDNVTNKSASATTGLLSNATQDLTKDQTDKQQKVLDIAKSDKTNSNKQDDDNDDDDDQTKKENQQQKSDQTGQIQAPNVDNKKSDTKEDEPKIETTSSTVSTNTPTDANKIPDSGEKSKVAAKTDEDQDGGDDDDDNQQKQKETQENGNSQSVDNSKNTKDENLDENLDKDDQDDNKVQETINTDNQDENNDNEQAEQGNFDGIEIKQADGKDKENKIPDKELKVPDPDIPRIRPKSRQRQRYPEDEGWSGNFVTYFLVFTLVVVIGYLILHNKNKVLGLLIEGCRRNRSSHRHRSGGNSSARYQRLSQSS